MSYTRIATIRIITIGFRITFDKFMYVDNGVIRTGYSFN